MAAWCRLTLLFLVFDEVLAIKVNVRGANHICASGAQVFHVNFGNGPIHQCDVMNTTPPSNNGKPSCAEKAKEQLKSSQGLYDSGKWGVSYHVNNLVNYKLPFLNMLSCSFCRAHDIRSHLLLNTCLCQTSGYSRFRGALFIHHYEVLIISSRRLM